MQAVERIYRRAMLWARIVERGFLEPHEGTWYEPAAVQAFLVEHDLGGELEPDERRLLLAAPGELAETELHAATWYCEPLAVLVWALGLGDAPPHDSDVAPFDVTGRVPVRPRAEADLSPRTEDELRLGLRTWFTLHRRYHAFVRGVQALDLRDLAAHAGHRDVLDALALHDDDLEFGGSPLSGLTVDDLPYGREWSDRVLAARLRALKWLCADAGAAFAAQRACPHTLDDTCDCTVGSLYAAPLDPDLDRPDRLDARGRTALHRAAFHGDLATLRDLLRSPHRIDALDLDGRTPLICALLGDHRDVVDLLLDRGADLERPDPDGLRPLAAAVRRARPGLVAHLLARGADPDGVSSGRTCALNEAAHARDHALARLLLDRRAHPDGPPGARPPIFCAIAARDPALIDLLAERGADLDRHDEQLGPPLLYALAEDARDCADVLLARGAAPHVADVREQSSLHWAACKGNLDHVRALLARGAAIDARSASGFTPLALSLVNGHPACAGELLDRGADPTLATADGRTPLHFAAQRGLLDLAVRLLDRGVDLEAADHHGMTPLLSAAAFDDRPDVLAALLARGADPTRRNGQGLTALHIAANRGRAPMVEVLLARGVPVDARTDAGQTPLHCAAMSPDGLAAARLLLAAGAKPDARDDADATPLGYTGGDPELVQLLLDAGATA